MSFFAFSDIHGNRELFDKVMAYIAEQKGPRMIYFLGDAIDRGVDGYTIMNELLNDPRVTYIMGNHENMFLNACNDIIAAAYEEGLTASEMIQANGGEWMFFSPATRLYFCNGGEPTFNAWVKAGCPTSIVNKIRKLSMRSTLQILNEDGYIKHTIDMCHAGCTSLQWEENDFQRMLWSREHFDTPWNCFGVMDSKHILVHGHTPIEYVCKKMRWFDCNGGNINYEHDITQPLVYASGTKIDIDTGTYKTNAINVLNLDTLESVQFKS